MASFRFDARDSSGANVSGEIEAGTAQDAARKLQAQGLVVTRVTEHHIAWRWGGDAWRRFFSPVITPASPKASAFYFHSFASLLGSGISTWEAARILSERAQARVFKNASCEIAEAALRGELITSVMPRYPAAFPRFVISMLRAGETSGRLEQAMHRLTGYFDRVEQVAAKYR